MMEDKYGSEPKEIESDQQEINSKQQYFDGRPIGYGKERNQPNYKLMAKALMDLYKRVGSSR